MLCDINVRKDIMIVRTMIIIGDVHHIVHIYIIYACELVMKYIVDWYNVKLEL